MSIRSRLRMAWRVLSFHRTKSLERTELPWDRPNGLCPFCGALLDEHMVGGYRLHDGQFSVSAAHYPHVVAEARKTLGLSVH